MNPALPNSLISARFSVQDFHSHCSKCAEVEEKSIVLALNVLNV